MKKFITLLLSLTLILSLTACGGNKENASIDNQDAAGNIEQTDQSSESTGQENQIPENGEQQMEQTEDALADNSAEETTALVPPKSVDDPAPLVSRQVEGLTQEQVSEVYKYIYFTMGVTYEEMEQRIPDEHITVYWEDLDRYEKNGIDPYQGLELYFQEKHKVEWPTADYIHPYIVFSGSGKTVKIDNPYNVDEDGYDCWRVYIDQASAEEVADFIDLLKENGVNFTSSFLVPEEVPAGTFDFLGQYEWQGVADYGLYVSFLHTEEPTTEFTGTGEASQLIINLYSGNPNE